TRPTPPSTPLFPYTTLFRSKSISFAALPIQAPPLCLLSKAVCRYCFLAAIYIGAYGKAYTRVFLVAASCKYARQSARLWSVRLRSEEHTSELQSRENLVCRL